MSNLGRQFSAREKQERTQDFHDMLRPMKETIKAQGKSFGFVSAHLRKNAPLLLGQGATHKDVLYWAVNKHAQDPENFLKNIGME